MAMTAGDRIAKTDPLVQVGEGPVCVSVEEAVAFVEAGKRNEESANALRRQVGGNHYLGHRIQPWDIWQEYGLNAFEGAVLKYLLRRKGDRLEDLRKARHTLDRLIEIEEAKGGVLRPEDQEAQQRPGQRVREHPSRPRGTEGREGPAAGDASRQAGASGGSVSRTTYGP